MSVGRRLLEIYWGVIGEKHTLVALGLLSELGEVHCIFVTHLVGSFSVDTESGMGTISGSGAVSSVSLIKATIGNGKDNVV